MDHIFMGLFAEEAVRIEVLALMVKDRRERRWLYFWVWADQEFPQLSLVYVHL